VLQSLHVLEPKFKIHMPHTACARALLHLLQQAPSPNDWEPLASWIVAANELSRSTLATPSDDLQHSETPSPQPPVRRMRCQVMACVCMLKPVRLDCHYLLYCVQACMAMRLQSMKVPTLLSSTHHLQPLCSGYGRVQSSTLGRCV
jgi:hypothetical protein